MPPEVVFIAGLVQLALLIWIVTFPIIIIKKLNQLIDLTRNK